MVLGQAVPSLSAANGGLTATATDLVLQPSGGGQSISFLSLSTAQSNTASTLASNMADNAIDDANDSQLAVSISSQVMLLVVADGGCG